MGKIEYFSIKLEKKNPIYFLGEKLRGTVCLKVTNRIKCNQISMNLTGRASVNW